VGEGDSGGREKSISSSDTSKGIWIDNASGTMVGDSDGIGREKASSSRVGEGNSGSEKDSILREDAFSSVIDCYKFSLSNRASSSVPCITHS
jgi:hypothetical protein